MKKWVCKICGYVYTGETPPEFCPQCKAPASKFEEQASGELVWADEHRIGVAEGVDAEGRVHRGWYVPGNVPSGSKRRLSRNC